MRILYYTFLIPLSLLPSRILYGISNFMFVIFYYIIGYRIKVVRSNITNSFPEFDTKQLRQIERTFYGHFCDLIVESIKAFTISQKELNERFQHRNPEIFNKYFDENKNITLVGGHSGNWELFALSIAQFIPHQPIAIYTPITNIFMNRKILSSRSKFGLWMKNYGEIKKLLNDNTVSKPVSIIFGADQCPNIKQNPFWMEFLNQETGVQFGAEKFAVSNDAPVIYGFIHRVKRGYFEVEYRLISETPETMPYGKITELHTKQLETDIKNDPANWLWTHKRWKRKKIDFENYQKLMVTNEVDELAINP